MKKETYTKTEIFAIIDNEIKKTMDAKNAYIAKNGFCHKDTLKSFDNYISALSGLYSKF